jgi:superfamily II DNA/RNA helicase
MHFNELGLSQAICQNLATIGYSKPTQIQAEAIPAVLRLQDIIATAQTGTGKTASFLLPIIHMLRERRLPTRMPQAIVLVPTRELATQVFENFQAFTAHTQLTATVLVGGESMPKQEKILARGVDVLIATPGRLLDLIERGKIILVKVQHVVIDEADRMLDMGFLPDVNTLLRMLPQNRQILMFSATMAPEIQHMADSFMVMPKHYAVARQNQTAETIQQFCVRVSDKDKRAALRSIIRQFSSADASAPKPTIIFLNRKRDISLLVSSLKRHGFVAEGLHGDLHQNKRNEILDQFRQGTISILVASDVAARGLDVEALGLVVNFNPPVNAEDYVHRIGRTGRAGNAGVAITLVEPKEEKLWANVLSLVQQEVPLHTVTLDDEKQPKARREKLHDAKQTVTGFGGEVPAFFTIPLPAWLAAPAS